jgi:cytochrome c oxidase subunit III
LATTLIPTQPTRKPEEPPSFDSTGNRPPGDRSDRDRGPDNGGGSESVRWSTPLSAYRAGMLFAMTSMVSLFVTLTVALQARWAHPKDWVSIRLPRVLYLNTLVLLISSLTIEVARHPARAEARRRRTIYLCATLLLGITFVGGQFVGWRDLVSSGVYLASNPGSLFLYVITGAHGLHLFGGMIALVWVIFRAGSLERSRKTETAVDVVALYWHFMDGLWVYLLGLLLFRVQR